MTSWKDQIPGAFAFFAGFPGRPAPFGLHPLDAARARKLIKSLKKEGICFEEAVAEIRRQLIAHGTAGAQLERHMQRVYEVLGPRLR